MTPRRPHTRRTIPLSLTPISSAKPNGVWGVTPAFVRASRSPLWSYPVLVDSLWLGIRYRFTGLLRSQGIAISMDGKGSWKDNVFVERLWKSVKYEEVYLRAYDSVPDARAGLGRYFEFYNGRRPHSSLGGMTPEECYPTCRTARARGSSDQSCMIPLINPGPAV